MYFILFKQYAESFLFTSYWKFKLGICPAEAVKLYAECLQYN